MCGLVYAYNPNDKPVNNLIINQYRNQRGRGTEGFGLFDGKHVVKTPHENKIMSYLNKRISPHILFHHRFPTSTKNVTNACHPFDTGDFFSKDKKFSGTRYILAHNGVLQNEHVLKIDHKDLGIEYKSTQEDSYKFNDSEALLWDVALYLEGFKEKLDAKGTIAFIVLALNKEKGDKVYFGRNNGNPLNMKMKKGTLFLSSTGKGKPIDTDKLYEYDFKLRQLKTKDLEIPIYSYTPPKTYTAPVHNHSPGYLPQPNFDELADGEEMYWEESTQTMWVKNEYGRWVNANDEYHKAQKDATKTTAESLSFEEDCSEVLLNSNSLTHKDGDGARRRDIASRYFSYMTIAHGDYGEAIDMATQDLKWLREEFAAQLGNNIDNKDLMYESRVTEGVSDLLSMNLMRKSDFNNIVNNTLRENKKNVVEDNVTEEDQITDEQLSIFRRSAVKLLMRAA